MKKVFIGALIMVFTISVAQAQQTTTEKGKSYHKEHRMGGFDQLNLSTEQKERLSTIKENYKKQSEELRGNSQLSDEQKKLRSKELHLQFRSEAEAILTPAQKEQLAKMKAERKAHRKQNDGI